MILKQDKVRGVVILDTTKYTEKLWHFKHKTIQKHFVRFYCCYREKLTKSLEKTKI